jgi:putative methyltransferase (TIGR04325 family)
MTSVKKFVPPVVVDFLVRLNRKRHGFLGDFGSWEVAALACEGYESKTLVSSYVDKYLSEVRVASLNSDGDKFTDRELRLLNAVQFGLSNLPNGQTKLKILDFGGAYGNHYPPIKRFLGNKLDQYVICESPAVSEAFSEVETENMSWITDLNLIPDSSISIVITSCALPYVENPHETLRELGRISDWIVMDRMPVLMDSQTKIFKQNSTTSDGKRVSYPAWYFSESEIFEWCEEFNLNIEFQWLVPEDRPYVLGERRPYRGYLLRKSRS